MIPESILEEASRRASAKQQWRYVFEEPEERSGYAIASDADCDTWFAGQSPVAVFAPDGSRET